MVTGLVGPGKLPIRRPVCQTSEADPATSEGRNVSNIFLSSSLRAFRTQSMLLSSPICNLFSAFAFSAFVVF